MTKKLFGSNHWMKYCSDQNQESGTDFFKPEQPDYIVNEFLNEDDDFLSGHSENPGSIPEGGDDEEDEEDADYNRKPMPKRKVSFIFNSNDKEEWLTEKGDV